MKKILFFFLIPFISYADKSPQEQFDSLKLRLRESKEDTNRAKLLCNLAYMYNENTMISSFNNNPDTGLSFAMDALKLSEKLSFNKGILYSKISLGRILWRQGKFSLALKYHKEALSLAEKSNDVFNRGLLNIYIAQDYADNGKYDEANLYLQNAETLFKDKKDTSNLANVLLLLSWVSSSKGNFPEAAKTNLEALRLYEATHDEYGTAIASSNTAIDFYKLGKYSEAIHYLKIALGIYSKYNDAVNTIGNYISLSNIFIDQNNYSEAMKYARLALAVAKTSKDAIGLGSCHSKIAEIYSLKNNYDSAALNQELALIQFKSINANQLLALEYGKLAESYVRLNKKAEAKMAVDSAKFYSEKNNALPALEKYYNGKQMYDSLMQNWQSAYLNFYKYVSVRDTITNNANTKKLMQSQVGYEFEKKEEAARVLQDKKDTRQRTIRNSITAALGGALIFLIVVFRQRNKINKARKRSDELLLNILPEEVASELKEKGSAEAKHFDEVTVMFTDFKDFTRISEKLSPAELVSEIHTCFKAFDDIIGKYNIEKIKTIGDSYMCAGGLPVKNTSHAEDVVRAAIEICKFMQKHLQERKDSGKEIFEIRIGIHTGPIVAGIVGVKKFAYDIWGDTVNIASRMEQNSEPGKINISASTYMLVKDKFNCIHRGKIHAKNKGEIDMYFVVEA